MMDLAKQGKISTSCTPNALMTLMEYVLDYGDEELKSMGKELVTKEVAKMAEGKHKTFVEDKIIKITEGKRDFYI